MRVKDKTDMDDRSDRSDRINGLKATLSIPDLIRYPERKGVWIPLIPEGKVVGIRLSPVWS
ncbi:MAG: hypothetical protein JXA46_01795 [Dehalococcoidales bacterium]|nr:hypothetical protein [Dehalococcoidales bacterium]